MMRKRRNFLLGIAAVLLTSSLALADGKIKGHIYPLPSEEMSPPLRLSCGVVIREWRAVPITDAAKKKVDRLCTTAADYFVPFMRKHGYKVSKADLDGFYFQYSMIPNNSQYRNLNDIKYRFHDRSWTIPVWGWTDHVDEWVFMIGNFWNPLFDKVFVHETFHALSLKAGTFDQHPGEYYKDREHVDERLCQQFVRELGY